MQVAFGKRVGTATINEFDDASLERVGAPRGGAGAARAGKPGVHAGDREAELQADAETFDESDRGDHAGIPRHGRRRLASSPAARTSWSRRASSTDGASFSAIANSKGNFGYQRATDLDFTCTVRTDDGRGSGWVGRNVSDVARVRRGRATSAPRIEKAKGSADAKALEPGKYTVILEPAAAAGLISTA